MENQTDQDLKAILNALPQVDFVILGNQSGCVQPIIWDLQEMILKGF